MAENTDRIAAELLVDGFCGIVADLQRIDRALGPKGESVFAKIAADIDAAYTEIKAARKAMAGL